MSKFRYLIDEDTPHAIRDQLRRREPRIVVLVVGEELAPGLSTPDSQILRWIEQEGYTLVSRNRRTMPLHLAEHLDSGGHVPGIFVWRPGYSIGRVLDDLMLIWAAGDPEDYRDRIQYLPL